MSPRSSHTKAGSHTKRRRAPYLGKITTRWCHTCDLPLLSGTICPHCGQTITKVKISPPGDLRPAFEYDIRLLRQVCDQTFLPGTGAYLFPDDMVVLLNKVGNLDLDYEIIAHGTRVGNLRYDLFQQAYQFHPARRGAQWIFKFYSENGYLDQNAPPKTVKYTLDTEKYAATGKSILIPGIETMDKLIQSGDPCIVFSDNGFLAAGYFVVTRTELDQMLAEGHGHVAKTKYYGDPVPPGNINSPESYPHVSWTDVISANQSLLDDRVAEATRFIIETINKYSIPVAVAYSGGKDSLATLLLVRAAVASMESPVPYHLFFADTGLELPEVLANVEAVVKWGDFESSYHIRSAGDKFWPLVEKFGPPARDFRFCCHTLKASQINKMVDEIGAGGQVLVFLGQRRYESFSRAEEKRVYTNSYVPLQVAASPIKDWNALQEWLFLLRERERDPNLPITPLYFKGHDRLGCYLCPAQNIASLRHLENTHPELYQRWERFLRDYQEQQGYPSEWVTWGLWRFKEPKGQWKELQEKLPAKTEKTNEKSSTKKPENLQLYITKGLSPCQAGGYSAKARFSIPLVIPEIFPWISLVDNRFCLDESNGLLYLDESDVRCIIYADGSLFLQSRDQNFDFDKFLKFLLGAVARGNFCQNCGVCVTVCPREALKMDAKKGTLKIIAERCLGLSCQKCTSHCPVYHLARDNFSSCDSVS